MINLLKAFVLDTDGSEIRTPSPEECAALGANTPRISVSGARSYAGRACLAQTTLPADAAS